MRTWSLINCFPNSVKDQVLAQLDQEGFRIVILHGDQITDTQSFFRQAALDIPQPQSLIARGSWDALSDNLWSEIGSHGETRFALIWDRCDVLLQHNVTVFLEAVDMFTFTFRNFTALAKCVPPVEMCKLVLIGQGDNFASP
jgi:hypothetical protein